MDSVEINMDRCINLLAKIWSVKHDIGFLMFNVPYRPLYMIN